MNGHVSPAQWQATALLDQNWEFTSTAAGSISEPAALIASNPTWLKAVVPGTAASSLRALGLWSLDSAPRAFDSEDFWFRLEFANSISPEGADETFLCFDGLATLADVWLNGSHILNSQNMFLAHRIPIGALRPQNELIIKFSSLDQKLTGKKPRPRWRTPMIAHQQLRYWRTTLLGRTPGWSPPAAAVGPWRPIRIESASTALGAPRFTATTEGTVGTVLAKWQLSGIALKSAELRVDRAGQQYRAACEINGDQVSASLVIPAVEKWWPHTHGTPALYTAQIVGLTQSGKSIETQRRYLGFRRVQLNTEEGNFAVHVNDKKIFCRGACWTPIDVVSLSASRDQYRHALEQVRDAGMNMVRVGGTMIYEDDTFYEECDRLGILVWQDFMFANMDYPEDDEFLSTVTEEVTQQLARLTSHPSIAVFCGNSEGEQQAAMWGASQSLWNPKLFHHTIKELVNETAPHIPYWPSSAHGGAFPHQPSAGTCSYYGVGAYLRPMDDARRSEVKFATECLAFANIPEMSGIERMPKGLSLRVHHPEWKSRSPRDLGAGWDFDDVRDFYLKELFKIDPLELRYADHDRYLSLGRIVCGEAMARTFAEWRNEKSQCNGGLIWFLRDLWPGAGWGIIDASGYAKAPYYFLKRMLQPICISLSDEGGNGIVAHVANDHDIDLKAILHLACYKRGETPILNAQYPLTLKANSAIDVSLITMLEGFSDIGNAYRFGPPVCDVVAMTLSIDKGLSTSAFHFPTAPLLNVDPNLGLTATAQWTSVNEMQVTVSTQRFAQYVSIEIEGFTPGDSYFHLPPGSSHSVTLSGTSSKTRLRGAVTASNCAAPITFEAQLVPQSPNN